MIEHQTKSSIIDFFQKKEVSKANINQLFIDCRTLLEHQKKKKEYPILAFYSDWLLHANIDRNPFVYDLLGGISTKFSGTDDYNIVPLLKIRNLIEELLSFVEILDLKARENLTGLFLTKLLCQIFENLKYRKVHFPIKPNEKQKEKIQLIFEQAKKVSENVEKIEKIKSTKLNPNTNYSNPIITSSIFVDKIIETLIYFNIEIDPLTFLARESNPKEITIISGVNFFILETPNKNFILSYTRA